MGSEIFCTALVDTRTTEGCQSEFGLSLYIEAYGKRLLFDTGAGDALLPNAAACGIALDRLDAIILSHGHFDHTGGLAKLAPACPVYAACGVDSPCFSCRADGVKHWISMPENAREVLAKSDFRKVGEFTEIMEGVFLTGAIARNSGETSGGNFFTGEDCTVLNTVPEEQSVLLKAGILFTGCCHAGIINTVEACRKAHPEIPIRVIAGGLHLLHAGETRLVQTAEYLSRLPLEELILMHCTGDAAGEYLKTHLACRVRWSRAGEKESLLPPH